MNATLAQPMPATQPARPKALERVKGLSYRDFMERHIIPRQPCVIEDAIDGWRALRKWTPDFWKRTYGDRREEIDGRGYALREVIDLALVSDTASPAPYYRNIHLGTVDPELMADISPYPLYCEPNWFHSRLFAPLRKSFMA
jgi:hypothetical protein